MVSLRSKSSRALFLARVLLGMTLVRDAGRFGRVVLVALAAGLGAASLWWALARGEARMLVPAAIGTSSAALAAGATHILSVRVSRKRQGAEFARAARRLGEEKTARSELRAACSRLSRAIERVVPEVLAEDDWGEAWVGLQGSGPALSSARATGADERDQRLAARLQRLSRAAAFLGGKDLELKRLALAGPCAEVIEQYRRLADHEQEILYMEDGGGEWLAAPIDRPLFVMLMRELLDNILEHAGGWNRITVTTEPVTGAIVLRVRDDGCGMPPNTLSDALAEGSRAHRGGLGIPFARAVAEAHGGSLRIESEPGHGTAVTVRFPTHA